MITEADTCRKYVLPKLFQAGWDDDPHSFTEQKTFTDGRIVVAGNKTRRRPQKRADQLGKDKKYFFTYSPLLCSAPPRWLSPCAIPCMQLYFLY